MIETNGIAYGRGERSYQCFVETCIQAPTHLHGDMIPLCCYHYSEQTGEDCDCTDDDYDDAMAESAQGTHNGRVPADFAPRCQNCAAPHATQACPEIRAALIDSRDDAHDMIAELRAQLATAHEAIGQSIAAMEGVRRVGMSDENDETTWATAAEFDAAWELIPVAITAARKALA